MIVEPWAVSLFVSAVHLVLASTVSAHIVLTKPDVRAAIGWAGLVWLTPVVGSILYALFGINRLRRRAGRIRRGRQLLWTELPDSLARSPYEVALPDGVPSAARPLATLVGAITGTPLVTGNAMDPLVNGDEAYPAMLSAIGGATRSIALATYIFDRGHVADLFIDALARAVQRGVAVRVLIDAVGARYSHPPIVRTLRAHGITVARFLPPNSPWRHPYINLRNHRKLMVVDGTIGFCGGLNIRDACVLGLKTDDPILDLHFRLRGPVVGQLQAAFADNWMGTTGKVLGPDASADSIPRLEHDDLAALRCERETVGLAQASRAAADERSPYDFPQPMWDLQHHRTDRDHCLSNRDSAPSIGVGCQS
jgi:cardiolipin synthase